MTSNKKHTIEEMLKMAELKGGRCLSKLYKDAHTKLDWECSRNHVWKCAPNDIRKGSWCPFCSQRARLTIKEMHEIANSREGKCLSTIYGNNRSILEWQCKKGHNWKASAHSVKSGSWCSKCSIATNSEKQRLTIEEMHQLAKSRGGVCLSNNYVNSNTNLEWQCKEGHIWKAMPSSIKSGSWCLKCAGKTKLTIEEMQKLAESKGGKCLSKEYINIDTKLEWQCKEGHIWKTTPYLIRKGCWCFRCSAVTNANKPHGKTTKHTIEQMHELAKLRDGKCLSEKYLAAHSPLKWLCKEGHIFEMRPNNVKIGQWCPNCARGIGERNCRKYFEHMFGHSFPSSKPSWLVTEKGTRLELDGYSKELNLAFEYQGQQHYKEVGIFAKTMNLKKRRDYDKLKRNLCKKKGVILLYIPYAIKLENMGNYIKLQCEKLGITIPNKNVKLESFKFYYPERISELQEIAKSRGGKLLSDTYLGSHMKLKWKCGEGHEWDAWPNAIKNGRWCPYCSGHARLTIEQMRQIAEANGGKCLSDKFIKRTIKLKWQCKNGHVWDAYIYNIKSGYWCRKCAKIKRIDRLRNNHKNLTIGLHRT